MLEKEVQKGKKIMHQTVGQNKTKAHFSFIGTKMKNTKRASGHSASGNLGGCSASAYASSHVRG
jgi:hypothetical protein